VGFERLGDRPIAVLNAGGWGTALALLLNRSGRQVRLWVRRAEAADLLRRERENATYLPGVRLPEDLLISDDLADTVAGCSVVVVAVISRYMREIARRLAPCLGPDALVVHGTKGFEANTWLRCSEILAAELGPGFESRLAVLSGPTHAAEVARRIPSAAVLGCRDGEAAEALQRLFAGPDFRLYTNPDLVGVEVCGSLKNVIALAAGASDGLGYGDNTKAALITRSLAEIGRLVAALGGDPTTVSGLAGLGDVVATCTSRHSRNRWAGEQLGQGQSLDQVLASTPMVVEGVPATRAAVALGARHGVELPIAEQVQAVLFEGRRPLDALAALMGREPRRER
jgi:glycerol-3-phosphate dehydrogenase (NAD(P)+)